MTYHPESQIRLPLLKSAKDGKIHSVLDIEKVFAKRFKLSNSEKSRIKKIWRRVFVFTQNTMV